MKEWHVLRKERREFSPTVHGGWGLRQSLAAVVAGVLLLLCGGPLLALDEIVPSDTPCGQVIPLTQITAEQALSFLTRLKIATVSRVPNTQKLLVTGAQEELQKAVAVLELVDTRTEFDVQVLGAASTTGALPSHAEIAHAVGGVCIGTFANPPKDKTKMRAILDVHGGSIVVIAPAFQLRDIRLAVELGPRVLTQRKSTAKPTSATAAPTLQAFSLLESTLSVPTGEPGRTPPVPGDPRSPGKFTLPREMSARLDARYERAMGLQAGGRPGPLSDARPASVAVSEGPQMSDGLSLGRTDPNEVQPPAAGGLQQVGAPPDPNAVPQPVAEPNGVEPVGLEPAAAAPAAAEPLDESTTLQPGQVVPSDADRITQPKIEPKPMMDAGLTDVMAEVMSPRSLYEPPEFANGDYIVEVNLPASLPVIDLLDLVGKYLNLSYIYDPQKVTGVVTVKLNGALQGTVRVKDLYLLLESVLQYKDLVMTRHKGNIVRIVPKLEAMNNGDPKLVGIRGQEVQAGDAVVSRVFRLKYIDNTSAENLLQGMGLTVSVTSIAESRTLIVTAYAHRMARIEQLLEMVDQPGAPRKFKYRQLRYTMAKTLADKVKALAEQLENVTVTIGTPELPQTAMAQQPGESDVAYRTRLAQLRAVQAQLRAQQLAARGQVPTEPKPGVYLDADERTNRVLMIGEEEQLATVEELVEALDVAQQDLQALQLYRMKHVDAEEVARKLQELGIISRTPETSYPSQRQTQSSRITGQPPGQPRLPQPTMPDTAGPAGMELTKEGLVGEPQVVVVESTNSLLVNGTPEQHVKIVSIIKYIDSEMDLEEMPYKIYPLENSSPNHLAEILEGLIQETVEQEKEGKIETTVVSREERIQIVPDPNTYSLIVYAKKKNQEWISTLITQLDKRRPQVLIDVTLVEITKDDFFDYGLNLIRASANLATTGAIPGLTPPGGSVIGKAVGTDPSKAFGEGGGLTAFYGDDQIQTLLRIMQSKTYGRVLAKPKLLVNDNEKGTINTKETTYVEVSDIIALGSVSTEPGSSTSIPQKSIKYEPYDAGITLDITPHISEGDLLRLDIMLTKSSFDLGPRGAKPPDTTSREVETAVTLPNGSTVILGGMLDMTQTKSGSKVPLLGDIPLIGGLFRSIHNSETGTKIYMFVKAEIIRPDETSTHSMKDLEAISARNQTAFEKHELEFQSYQDWPGLKPKPVNPPKVLDAQ